MLSKIFFVVLSVSIMFISCGREESFDETLLIGKWKQGDLYYKYLSDYNGASWDESDDVHEDEAQPFTWSLVGSKLRQIHDAFGMPLPKTYTVTELTATTLKYRDAFNKRYSFIKVE